VVLVLIQLKFVSILLDQLVLETKIAKIIILEEVLVSGLAQEAESRVPVTTIHLKRLVIRGVVHGLVPWTTVNGQEEAVGNILPQEVLGVVVQEVIQLLPLVETVEAIVETVEAIVETAASPITMFLVRFTTAMEVVYHAQVADLQSSQVQAHRLHLRLIW
jgi:hypothetical protein